MSKLTHEEKICIYRVVDEFPELKDFGIVYVSEMDGTILLRESALPDGYKTWITLERKLLLPEATPVLKENKKSGLILEMVGMGLSCASAAFAGAATVAATSAAPVTAGSSLVISAIGYSATVASAAQCGVSAGRVLNAIFVPKNNDMLDSNIWVNRTSQALDAIALAGGVVQLGSMAQVAIRLSRTTNRPLTQVIKGMTRSERKKLAQDIARYADKAKTRKQFIRLARAGHIPKIFTRNQISKALISQLLESLSTVLTVSDSARAGVIHLYFVE